MAKTKNILIIENSTVLSNRFYSMLKSELAEIDIIIARGIDSAIKAFQSGLMDFVVLGNHLEDSDMLKLNIACSYHNSCLVVLTEYPAAAFKSKYHYLEAEYIMDKSTGFEQLPLIIANNRKSISNTIN